MLGTGDASLTYVERDGAVESAANGHADDLEGKEAGEEGEDVARLVVDGMHTDNVYD